MSPFPMILCACAVMSLDCYHSEQCYSLRCPDHVITIDVRLYSCNNARMTGWIFIKFGMDVMPLVPGL
jgi:hypothetical protein